MTPQNPTPRPSKLRSPWIGNWISLSGWMVVIASLFAFAFLSVLAWSGQNESPYIGILTYLVAPGFFALGVGLVAFGWWRHRRHINTDATHPASAAIVIDLTRARDRQIMIAFGIATVLFLLATSVGSYQTYHLTKSVNFCGETCHTPMEPQYVAYQHSPHAKVHCTDCHIGPGAINTVKAKFNGLHQVFAVMTDHYDRPITKPGVIPIHQKTCEQCHWPKNYIGNVEKTYTHFLDDDENTPYSLRLQLKVGGADPTHGPVGGIHWHMNLGNKVEFASTDPKSQKIVWVKVTKADGKVTEYKSPEFKGDLTSLSHRTMDCLDCHSRPAHNFQTPNDAIEQAMAQGRISTKLPAIKRHAAAALTATYTNRDEAISGIAARLKKQYNNHPDVQTAINEIQGIHRQNFFPEMKTDWRVHPNQIGHKDWAGCFRCHGAGLVASDGKQTIQASDCNSCHTIQAEAKALAFDTLSAKGLEFKHPEEGWNDMKCHDCHNGTTESN